MWDFRAKKVCSDYFYVSLLDIFFSGVVVFTPFWIKYIRDGFRVSYSALKRVALAPRYFGPVVTTRCHSVIWHIILHIWSNRCGDFAYVSVSLCMGFCADS